jgi:hypothetical protein
VQKRTTGTAQPATPDPHQESPGTPSNSNYNNKLKIETTILFQNGLCATNRGILQSKKKYMQATRRCAAVAAARQRRENRHQKPEQNVKQMRVDISPSRRSTTSLIRQRARNGE